MMKKTNRGLIQIQLKKNFKLLKYTFLAILCFLVFDFIITVEFKEPSRYPYRFFGGDDYTYFGDGRFQVLSQETKSLFDKNYLFEGKQISECLVGDIEKYIQTEEYLYLLGYYTCSWGLDGNGNVHYQIPNSEELIMVDNLNEVPHYIILNYETGDIQLYKTLGEVSEKDRKIFEKSLNFWCKFKRTCYEK